MRLIAYRPMLTWAYELCTGEQSMGLKQLQRKEERYSKETLVYKTQAPWFWGWRYVPHDQQSLTRSSIADVARTAVW